MMEIHEITVGELPDFVASDFFKRLETKPITALRAISQFRNPAASANDVALVIATEKDKLLAFVGLLPDRVANDSIRVFSNSCWWAKTGEGGNVSLPLFLRAFQASHRRMFFTDCLVQTKSILEKTGLFVFSPPNIGFRYFFRFYFGALAKRKGMGKLPVFFFSFSDKILNTLLSIWSRIAFKTRYATGYKVERLRLLPESLFNFIEKNSAEMGLEQSGEKLNWIVQNPWISVSDSEVAYPFTYSVESFHQEFLVMRKDAEVKAILLVSVRDNQATIPYAYFDQDLRKEVAQNICAYLMDIKADSLAIFNPVLLRALEKISMQVLFRKKIRRFTGHSKELNFIFAQKFFQDGEGDVVFT